MEFKARNINGMFSSVLRGLKSGSYSVEQTRNGPVLAFPEPVILTYTHPKERVLFHVDRDAPHIFHLMECIWLLAGRQDVAFLKQFNQNIGQFSDDGETFNAAYGYRLREHFGVDQLVQVIEILHRDPGTRQAVLQLWDPADLAKKTLDKACNLEVIFDTRCGRLNMTVYNRSNDVVWGALGANAVHFTFLQEFIACAVGLRVGEYRQVSNNLHLYLSVYDGQKYLDNPPDASLYDGYSAGRVSPSPLMLNGAYMSFLADCEEFCRHPYDADAPYTHPFFLAVAHPMAMISKVRKAKAGTGQGWAEKIKAEDWRFAAFQWIHNRELKKQSTVKT